MPQYTFIAEPNGKVKLDFIGRFENLANDFEHICSRLEKPSTLKHKNPTRSKHKDYRSYYNARTIDIVSRLYAKDNKLFSYEFDG